MLINSCWTLNVVVGDRNVMWSEETSRQNNIFYIKVLNAWQVMWLTTNTTLKLCYCGKTWLMLCHCALTTNYTITIIITTIYREYTINSNYSNVTTLLLRVCVIKILNYLYIFCYVFTYVYFFLHVYIILWVWFTRNTHTDKKCIAWMHCKSLWIKASDKCNVVTFDASTPLI